jgi:hypothetical protein
VCRSGFPAATIEAALVLLGVAQPVGFGVEHLVEGGLHAMPDLLRQMILDNRLVKAVASPLSSSI